MSSSSEMHPAIGEVRAREANDLGAWILTLDHRRVAKLYALVIGLALVFGAFLSIGLGLQGLAGKSSGLDAQHYRELYSMHGLVMVFLVALPAIPAVLGNAWLPEMLGVERMAWPRVNVLAFHLFASGALVVAIASLVSPADVGWSFDLPFAASNSASVAWCVMGVIVVATSFALSSANVLATIVESRIRARGRLDLPLFAWSLGASALVQAIASPILIAVLALLIAQRFGAADVFSAGVAADVRFGDWFWFWGHPALCAMLLAAVGLVSELLEDERAPRRAADRTAIACIAAITVFAFTSWGVHLASRYTAATRGVSFSALSLASGAPFVVLALGWWKSMRERSIELTTATCYAMSFMVLAAVGGMAGMFLGVLPTGAYLANTSFSTAQFHYLVVGGTLVALLGGLHRAWSTWFGVALNEGRGKLACALVFVGVNLAFFPSFVLGYLGQPAREGRLVADASWLGVISAAGSFVLVLALLYAAWNLVASLFAERALEPERAP